MRKIEWAFLFGFVVAVGCGGDDDGGKQEPVDAGDNDDGGAVTEPPDSGKPKPKPDATVPPPRGSCGNGRLDDGEACDDGNTKSGDGCDSSCEEEPGFNCAVAGAECEECGNGIVESSETCDDGNHDADDGCDAECQLEGGGFSCPVPGEACELCGNGELEPNERCDEGDTADGVGCAADCRSIDEHFTCPVAGEPCVECGDGVVGGDEVCDDGNVESGDGCVFNCSAEEPSFRCPLTGGGCTLCGDGVIAGDEQCDDGNFAADDGCSARCETEPGATCLQVGVLCSQCGNGYIEFIAIDDNGTPSDPSDDFFDSNDPSALEGCDDGNLQPGDGCSDTCQLEVATDPPWTCPVPGLSCGRCGDGVTQPIEACDDGGGATTASNDGCSDDCTMIEAHYTCPATGGACVLCGDGQLDSPLEGCDDQNVLSGDGCDRLCQIETNVPWVCPTAGQACQLCGNGIVESSEACDDGNRDAGDGCAADCSAIDTGYNCFFPGFPCAQCGDGVLSPGERCDEGDLLTASNATAGCDDQCQVVAPFTCPIPGQSCVQCGDGTIGAAESCEDGNIASGDGCNSVCQIEPGYDCTSGTCLAASCGDGFAAGNEECDDGNHLSGDGCNFVCHVEAGWTCAGGAGCHRTVCGNGVVEGAEACDDGNVQPSDGCSALCQFETGYYCPKPSEPCELAPCGDGVLQGAEQCDDGSSCTDGSVCDDAADCTGIGDGSCAPRSADGCTATCALEPNFDCPDPGLPCLPAVCGNGAVEGLEACDDGGTTPNDGCDGQCKVETFYRCKNEPSDCRPIIEFVAIRRFNISQVSPAGLNYEPDRRAFAGHKSQSSQDPIELCLDGTILDPTDGAFPNGTIFAPGEDPAPLPVSCADMPAANPCYELAERPVTSGTLVGSTYDPFTDHYLFITVNGQTETLTDVPRGFDPATQDITDFQVVLSDLDVAADLTVGEDGDLYVADSNDVPNPVQPGVNKGMIKVFERRRNGSLEIVVPDCATTPEPNCTSFNAVPNAAREWSAAVGGADVLGGLFTVPGENLLGVFNQYQGAVQYTGSNLETMPPTPVTSSEYFTFFDPTLTAKPPIYGRSALPGLLFTLGTIGTSYTKYSQSAETAADGGAFIICPQNPSEDCQLFARTCFDDADCADIVPGTECDETAPVPYCHSPGDARDDGYQVDRDNTGGASPVPLDVLANDSLSESACVDPNLTILSICGDGVQQPYEAANPTNCPTDTGPSGTPALTPGGGVTYDAPDDGKCGFLDTFTYTVDLGGGVIDTATVRVVVACVCGDGLVDSNEQCDQGANNAAAGTLIDDMGTPDPSDDVYARCSPDCFFNVFCGDNYVVAPEECDQGDTVNGDGCSQFCTLESTCGDGSPEGAEECDDGNTVSGDTCNANCTLPTCGDANVDVQLGETCDDGNRVVADGCSATCKVETVCGNHLTELGEDCDDGNRANGDGCNAQCKVENVCGNDVAEGSEVCDGPDSGTCPMVSSVQIECTNAAPTAPNLCLCANYCGDGAIGGLEECDAGLSGSATCRGAAPASGTACTSIRCGDGIADSGEECDDGNTNPTDGCTNDCHVLAICGNGTLEGSEECDDHNNVSGDGCSSACKDEATVCGDGVVDFDEQCDDHNTTPGDGCDAACLIEGGMCGNGRVDLGEQCDDGNTMSDDGCSTLCELEQCGNGTKDTGEECDDGNTSSGDGCSALCRIEVQ